MYRLDLTNLKTSEVKYEVSRFPDGQQQVKILGRSSWPAVDKGEEEVEKVVPIDINEVHIKARLNNFLHLEVLCCAVASLRELGVKRIDLTVPYFLGSRSDRKFEERSNNYLKTVICPIVNSLKLNSVTVLDPHSDVLEACLDNFNKVDNLNLVNFTLNSLYSVKSRTHDNLILISPDAGANKKIFKIAEQIGYRGEIITCGKSRDEQGKLSRTEIPLQNHHIEGDAKDFIIIDDICDGGATFINIVKELKKGTKDLEWDERSKIYLIVTHGIFSKGFSELNKYFDGIYCTNSFRDVADNEYDEKTNVKQLKVF